MSFEVEQNLKTWPSNGARTIAFDGKTGHLFAMASETGPPPPTSPAGPCHRQAAVAAAAVPRFQVPSRSSWSASSRPADPVDVSAGRLPRSRRQFCLVSALRVKTPESVYRSVHATASPIIPATSHGPHSRHASRSLRSHCPDRRRRDEPSVSGHRYEAEASGRDQSTPRLGGRRRGSARAVSARSRSACGAE